jgi:hypothetical protein
LSPKPTTANAARKDYDQREDRDFADVEPAEHRLEHAVLRQVENVVEPVRRTESDEEAEALDDADREEH